MRGDHKASNHYLVIYDTKARKSTVETYEDSSTAVAKYKEKQLEYGFSPDFEVVLLSSKTEKNIHDTHPKYFINDLKNRSGSDKLSKLYAEALR